MKSLYTVAMLVVVNASLLFSQNFSPYSGHAPTKKSIVDAPRILNNTTFSEHVAPIVWKHCVSCHRLGEVAPFPLTSYEDVAKRSQMIRFVVQSRYMPPWKPENGYGKFADHRGLSDEQIGIISEWVEQGALEGDPTMTPPLPEFPEGSQLGKPDLVLTMSEEWNLEGNNKDMYRNFVLPTNLLENKTIAAIEFRPGNPKIVHHALLYLDENGEGRQLDALDPLPGYDGFGGPGFEPSKNLLGWVPGSVARFFPDGLGITAAKNSDVVVQIHYAPSATPETDRSSINIFFAKKPAEREIVQTAISPKFLEKGERFIIPANTKRSFKGKIAGLQIPIDISLIAVAPHMHLLGLSCRAYAVAPNNDTIPIVKISEWDFEWQGYYMAKNLIKIPRGSALYYEADYDNTTDNPENPNTPPKLTTWGESTFDEMFLCYFLHVPYRTGDENITNETETPTHVEDANADYAKELYIAEAYPNPTSEQIGVLFSVAKETQAEISIYDMMGNNVFSQTILANAGKNYYSASVSKYMSGNYFIRIAVGATSMGQPFAIAR